MISEEQGFLDGGFRCFLRSEAVLNQQQLLGDHQVCQCEDGFKLSDILG